MIRGAPGVIHCSIIAPSSICSSIALGPLVIVLLDALNTLRSSDWVEFTAGVGKDENGKEGHRTSDFKAQLEFPVFNALNKRNAGDPLTVFW